MAQGIVLKNTDVLIVSNITKIVPEDYSDPDLELESPYYIKTRITDVVDSVRIEPYLNHYTDQTIISLRSEDILTMFTPKQSIVEEYKKAIGVEDQLELNIEEV